MSDMPSEYKRLEGVLDELVAAPRHPLELGSADRRNWADIVSIAMQRWWSDRENMAELRETVLKSEQRVRELEAELSLAEGKPAESWKKVYVVETYTNEGMYMNGLNDKRNEGYVPIAILNTTTNETEHMHCCYGREVTYGLVDGGLAEARNDVGSNK